MKQDETRRKLIDGTIRIVARDGLDKATTKQISTETELNEVYIYRCFKDKEDMLAKAFCSLDEELVEKALLHISVMNVKGLTRRERCRFFFLAVWRFLLSNRSKCLAFIRYYYSPYFQKYSAAEHKKRYEPVVEKIAVAFRKEANVWMILNHVLTTMLDFSVKVFDGAVPDNDDTSEHVFRLIYQSVSQYFETEEIGGEKISV
ncbi:MAG: TetR/AcrR family transcriptional regulator [Clostridia bacterium]|nr:TetR/AcrR family transcriptional regulator [Clostridia bacterium]